MKTKVILCSILFLVLAGFANAESARDILEATGVKGGLVVHVGCGDGSLTAGLHANDSYLVQGLDSDAGNVRKARNTIQRQNLYGKVSVNVLSGDSLPYIDNVVNLLVSEDLGAVSMSEVMRVLVPEGVAYIRKNGKWTKSVKARPENIDEWTHFLHGADGNAVAEDSVVDSPHHIQWVASPRHSKSHSHLSSINVMVSAKGKLFYIADESSFALPHLLPSKWALFARDAFNGVTLWRRPISSWQVSSLDSRNRFPVDLHRRLVVEGDTVYATLSVFGPVTALDAATGETIRTYAGTENTSEIIVSDGVLYLSVHNEGSDRINRREMATWRTDVQPKRIMAFKAGTGKLLWEKRDKDAAGILPMTLAAKGGRVYFQNTENIFSLDAGSGKEAWRSAVEIAYDRPNWSAPTLVVQDKVVLAADRGMNKIGPNQKQSKAGVAVAADLFVLSVKTGEKLWSVPCYEGDNSPVDLFVSGSFLWMGETAKRNDQDYTKVRDLATGDVVKEYPEYDGWVEHHHHRCYRDKATSRFVLAGRTGVEFIDKESGKLTPHQWIRGNCKTGILPCNGLLYVPADQCGCYVESKLNGFHALAPKRSGKPYVQSGKIARLEKGPAYNKVEAGKPTEMDWPTYRGDAARSGRATAPVSPILKPSWNVELGGKLTPPVAANNKVFVASVDSHVLYAVDASGGKTLWTYTAGGRIDSPPTIANGLAVFGSRDGWVYALRAADGELAWRFRAAPDDRQLVANGQIESVWPVHGSVLVQDGAVHCAAGRSSYVDGGVYMYKIDLMTGKVIEEKQFNSRDPKTGRTVALYEPFSTQPSFVEGKAPVKISERMVTREMPGVLPDILSSDGKTIWMRSVNFNDALDIQKEDRPHVFSWTGYLDDSWWDRGYWVYGDHVYAGMVGVAYAKKIMPTGRLLTFDDTTVYGYQDETFKKREPAGIFAMAKVSKFTGGERKPNRKGAATEPKLIYDWQDDVPLYPNGMVLAGDTIFIAGPPKFDEEAARAFLAATSTDEQEPSPVLKDALDTFGGKKGMLLRAVNKSDGKKIAEYSLDSVPVFDGLIAADRRLYITTKSGSLVCMASDG